MKYAALLLKREKNADQPLKKRWSAFFTFTGGAFFGG